MRYVSTRGAAPPLAFDEALLAGLAPDGGLYVPEEVPAWAEAEIRALADLPYAELATRVMAPYLGGRIAEADFASLVADAYAGFGHGAVAPLIQLDHNTWLLELFHGPTLAFKDHALQLVGRLFDHVLGKRGERVVVIGATSGDTGSAAIEACREREAIEIFILHPKGRVSEVQRRQMTTVLAPNVHNVAIDGTFDDCQNLVKAMFNDQSFRDEMRLAAVNSINWARIMAQIVYYFAAAVALGAPKRPVAFAVPTGNFGNVYAGYVARRMGLPISRLVVGSNRNDGLTRFFESGVLTASAVEASLSPAMDIQVPSNFERLLFDLYHRDGKDVASAIERLRTDGQIAVGQARLDETRRLFEAYRLDDEGTIRAMAQIHGAAGVLVDPHTSIGVAAARACRRDSETPVVALATAHPAKFPDAVEKATGIRPALPARLSDLLEREERVVSLPDDLGAVEEFVRARVALKGAA